MKLLFFSRLLRNKRSTENPPIRIVTTDDIRKKLEHYQKTEGPANFGHAGLYFVSELDRDSSTEIDLVDGGEGTQTGR